MHDIDTDFIKVSLAVVDPRVLWCVLVRSALFVGLLVIIGFGGFYKIKIT